MMFITRYYKKANGKIFWHDRANVYYIADSPTIGVKLDIAEVDAEPATFEDVEIQNDYPRDIRLFKLIRERLGDRGIIGIPCGVSSLVYSDEDVFDYFDNPEKYLQLRDEKLAFFKKKFEWLMSLDIRPDFMQTGCSGSLIFQTPDMFRELGLPIVKATTKMASQHGIPTHLHSCGPQMKLLEMCYEETDLTIVEPLEIPPMGDCDLKTVKQRFGDKFVLKGNIHTTDVMLNGTRQDVVNACRKAIDDAAAGGKFILATGDQCGRDTPYENIQAMVETARTYGKY